MLEHTRRHSLRFFFVPCGFRPSLKEKRWKRILMFHLSEQRISNGNLISLPASGAESQWSGRRDKRRRYELWGAVERGCSAPASLWNGSSEASVFSGGSPWQWATITCWIRSYRSGVKAHLGWASVTGWGSPSWLLSCSSCFTTTSTSRV